MDVGSLRVALHVDDCGAHELEETAAGCMAENKLGQKPEEDIGQGVSSDHGTITYLLLESYLNTNFGFAPA